MKKVEVIVRPSKLDDIKTVIYKLGLKGMTVSEVIGHGLQKGQKEVYRGTAYTIDLLPKIKIELVMLDEQVNKAVDAITKVCRAGEHGDGKIFITHVENAIRVRTGESGEKAII